MNKVFILRRQIVTIHGQTHQVNGHFPHVRCATCHRNSQCKSTEEHSCNVNVKLKMTVHEQVHYRGTLQCYNGLPMEEMSHSLFLHQFQITLLLLLHPFNSLFSSTTWVSWYQKGKTSLDLNEARDYGVLGCSGISWTICKLSAPRSRQITTPAPHHSIDRPDALHDAQPTVSKY